MEVSEKNYLKLNDIEAYRIAFHLSNYVWNVIYTDWDIFAKKTIGVQMVNAINSISANIAEGFGRYFKKDKVNFYRYSKGSLKESFDWNEKARVSKLLTEDDYKYILNELDKLPKALNSQIKYTNEKLTI